MERYPTGDGKTLQLKYVVWWLSGYHAQQWMFHHLTAIPELLVLETSETPGHPIKERHLVKRVTLSRIATLSSTNLVIILILTQEQACLCSVALWQQAAWPCFLRLIRGDKSVETLCL